MGSSSEDIDSLEQQQCNRSDRMRDLENLFEVEQLFGLVLSQKIVAFRKEAGSAYLYEWDDPKKKG